MMQFKIKNTEISRLTHYHPENECWQCTVICSFVFLSTKLSIVDFCESRKQTYLLAFLQRRLKVESKITWA